MKKSSPSDIIDLFVIGGGINGCGIARDAAGRGLWVELAEMNDLASATSSASTKLFHGGLRYLEYWKFRLVREALIERETLLQAMPHISWPMRFILPYHEDMRFDGDTPTAKLLRILMPWMKARRPAWLIRLGLFLYDNLGGRRILKGTTTLNLTGTPEGIPLNDRFKKAYEYSDCWIEDSRLVVLNARDAVARGAIINTYTKVISAEQVGGIWHVTIKPQGGKSSQSNRPHVVRARMLVNAGGPWVVDIIGQTGGMNNAQDVTCKKIRPEKIRPEKIRPEKIRPEKIRPEKIRLVRGSHIVTRKLYDHDKCYFFQGGDGRIIFMIPYEGDFTLIGTTDADHLDANQKPVCTPEEQDYLLKFASQYLKKAITSDDVVWTYSGVRPLYDDGANSATAATRDYILKLDESAGAPLLNVFGGKITTYRKLAEAALEKITPFFVNNGDDQSLKAKWTAGVALPGGDFPVDGVADLIERVKAEYPFLDTLWASRLVKAYGLDSFAVLGDAKTKSDLGRDFGASLTLREVNWLVQNEFARTAEDIVWRRSKLGLRLTREEIDALDLWLEKPSSAVSSIAS